MNHITGGSTTRGSSTASNPGIFPLADALADDIARSLHQGWKLKHGAALTPRWPGELLHQFFEYTHDQWPHHVVLSAKGEDVTYSELELRSNQLAHFLHQNGVICDTRVGICLPPSIDAYVALLAVLKTRGRYVQLDPQFPCERIRHTANDGNLISIITTTELGLQEADVGTSLIFLDRWRDEDAASPTDQLACDKQVPGRDVCYIIYTTNTTDRPKGVAVEPRMKLQKLRSLVCQQNEFGLRALTLVGRNIEGFLSVA